MIGEELDLTSEPGGSADAERAQMAERPGKERPYVGINFACCGVYARIYINRKRTAYEGNCPKCSGHVRLVIGPDGTDQRFFSAY
jgi:hypothetical protein